MGLVPELRRHNVFRDAIAYAIIAGLMAVAILYLFLDNDVLERAIRRRKKCLRAACGQLKRKDYTILSKMETNLSGLSPGLETPFRFYMIS
jgi:hypothetical protein